MSQPGSRLAATFSTTGAASAANGSSPTGRVCTVTSRRGRVELQRVVPRRGRPDLVLVEVPRVGVGHGFQSASIFSENASGPRSTPSESLTHRDVRTFIGKLISTLSPGFHSRSMRWKVPGFTSATASPLT